MFVEIPSIVILSVLLFCVVCAVITYRATYAYFRNTRCELETGSKFLDMAVATVMAACGPAGLICVAVGSGYFKHGLSVRKEKAQ